MARKDFFMNLLAVTADSQCIESSAMKAPKSIHDTGPANSLICFVYGGAQPRILASLVVRLPRWHPRSVGAALDIPACTGRYLLLSILFAAVSDQGTGRARRHYAGTGLPGRCVAAVSLVKVLVCAFAVLDFFKFAHTDARDMDWPGCF